jgi:hypothetical protein
VWVEVLIIIRSTFLRGRVRGKNALKTRVSLGYEN